MSSSLTRLLSKLSLIAVGVIFAANAQEPAKPSGQAQKPRTSDQGETVRIGSEEVLLDVVARDKKGRPGADLKRTRSKSTKTESNSRSTRFVKSKRRT